MCCNAVRQTRKLRYTQCPFPWDVLAFPTELVYLPEGAKVYFNRPDVKKAINAPLNDTWSVISDQLVIIGKSGPEPEYHDDSPDPIQGVLPQVIEATNRVLVANGDLDMIIITNGSLLAIQNMTWNGQLGRVIFEHFQAGRKLTSSSKRFPK